MQKGLKILMDYQIFSLQTFGGISRVFTELYKNFNKEKSVTCNIPITFSENEYLKDVVRTNSIFPGKKIPLKRLFYYAINRVYSTYRLLSGNFDVFQPTYYDPYFLPLLKGKPFVLVVHDMTHEIFPETVSIQDKTIEWKRKLVHKASKIIAISENTKKDIVKFYRLDASKIEVVYWATSITVPKEKLHLNLPEKYILFVGNRNTYKNFELFFKSVASILKSDKDLNLVCVGSSKFSDKEYDMFEKEDLMNKIIHIKYKDDKELAYIYNKAICFVFPSLYEGFGIPVLEAFACDCPVVSSNTSSLPEIGGNAVEYFDPQDAKSIENSIRKVIENSELRKEMIEKGKRRLKNFNWDNVADQFIKIYKNINS